MNAHALRSLALPHGSLVFHRLVPQHVSASAWYRAHLTGDLVRLHRGVSRLVQRSETPLMRIEAALAAAMPHCVVGGLAAAWLWGAASARFDVIDLIAPPRRHPGRLAGVEFHRPTDACDVGTVIIDGLPVCAATRAALDIAAWHPHRLPTVLAELAELGRFDLAELGAVLAAKRRHGRPGVSSLERVLAGAPYCLKTPGMALSSS
ncbi:MAG: AbiEi antitoxin C-terminal domain [Actinomycetota bacterium]|jgi:hypothetical protein